MKNHPAGKGVPSGKAPALPVFANKLLYVTTPALYQSHQPAVSPIQAFHGSGGPGPPSKIVPAVEREVVIVTGMPFTSNEEASQQSPKVGTIPDK